MALGRDNGDEAEARRDPDAILARMREEEADEARNAAKVLGLRLREILPAGLPGRAHSLVVYEKIADTPRGYPRKFAKIKARPL